MGVLADLPELPAEHDDGQEAAQARILEWFRLPAIQRGRRAGDDTQLSGESSRRRFWRDRSGKFARPPEIPPAPEVDDVLTLAHAASAAARSTSRLGASGRDVTGERMRAPRPAPRPASELPFQHEVTFPGADHGEDCRCHFCYRPERPWWLSRRRNRRR